MDGISTVRSSRLGINSTRQNRNEPCKLRTAEVMGSCQEAWQGAAHLSRNGREGRSSPVRCVWSFCASRKRARSAFRLFCSSSYSDCIEFARTV